MKLGRKSTELTGSEVVGDKHKKYSTEERIRIVMEGMSSDDLISDFCSLKGLSTTLYDQWKKEFLEADKSGLAKLISKEATNNEVYRLKIENMYLMQLVAELNIENGQLKKNIPETE